MEKIENGSVSVASKAGSLIVFRRKEIKCSSFWNAPFEWTITNNIKNRVNNIHPSFSLSLVSVYTTVAAVVAKLTHAKQGVEISQARTARNCG